MTHRHSSRLAVVLLPLMLPLSLRAQNAPDTTGPSLGWLTRRIGGQAQVFSELYGVSGMESRRPGSTWRVMATPRLGLIGGNSVGFDILLSSEGNQARQSINQVAIEPTWGWGQLHAGDFSKDYTPYTMSGLRIRGGGIDLQRMGLRASVQAGRSSELVAATGDGPTYRRSIVAAALGAGTVGERSLDVQFLRARDGILPFEPLAFDTLGIDTLPADLRPQQRNRPQENVVLGVGSTLRLFARRLALKGEVAGALLTRDLTSPTIIADSAGSSPTGLAQLRTSSSGDLAWNADAQWQGRLFGLRGGYEEIGAGYTSLGLAYLVNDRRSWNAGGDVRLFGNALMLQGRYQQQENNLQSQRLATTTRDVTTGTAVMRLPGNMTMSLVGLLANAANAETNDSLRVDNRSATVNASLSRPWKLASRNASVSLAYAVQSVEDLNPVRLTPRVTVQTANAAASVPVADWLTASPAMSAVLPGGNTDGKNLLGSLRLAVKELKGLSSSAQFSQTFVSARPVTTALAQLGYTLPGGYTFSLQARVTSFGAQGVRPAFNERFLTTTLGRGF